jgi:hypothetical protein
MTYWHFSPPTSSLAPDEIPDITVLIKLQLVGDEGLEPPTSSLAPDEIPDITILIKLQLVGDEGLEPPTSSLSVTRSNQLS